QIGGALAQHSGAPLRTEDLVPLPGTDARGVGLSAAALPLTLAGLLPAVALLLAFPGRPWLRAGAFTAAAVVMTLTVAVLLRFVFGSIADHFWPVSAGLLLGVLAMGLPVLGLGSLFGRVGLGIGAAVAVLLGNPLSGLAGAPELLPAGWGTFGQLLPQGANATLLRSTAYFPDPFAGSTATTALAVLACWAAAGVGLIALARK
ncbi:MAG: integral rane protein, partial [Mycobacterium sp.]|nr:integral rane protein [Mycobacterium sp.]